MKRVLDEFESRRLSAITERKGNRIAVLAHPDLAAKLCEPPLNYDRPDQWTGYIPPEIWNNQRNDSGRRAALIELLLEALLREEAA